MRQPTAHVLSRPNILGRHTGSRLSSPQRQSLSAADLTPLLPEAEQALTVRSGLAVLQTLRQQSKTLEKTVTKHVKHTPAYQQ